MTKPTNVEEFLNELGAGTVAQALAAQLTAVATAVNLTGKKGTINLALSLQNAGDDGANQLQITSVIKHSTPTTRGSKQEDVESKTTMFLTKEGLKSYIPKVKVSDLGEDL